MKKYLILLLFVKHVNADNYIECYDGACQTSVEPTDSVEKSLFSKIIYNPNEDDIVVATPIDNAPRGLRMSLNHEDYSVKKNVSIDLSSGNTDYKGADLMLVADQLNHLSVDVSGYEGKNGKNATEICYENIISGKYGNDMKEAFINKRQVDPSLPLNACTFLDIDELQANTFTCDDPSFNSNIDELNPTVQVKRLKGRTRCLGLALVDVCLDKTLEVDCSWKLKYTDGAFQGQYSSDPTHTVTKKFNISESQYLSSQSDQSYKNYLCQNATKLDTDPKPSNIILNSKFDLNLNNWDLGEVIREFGALKFNGGKNKSIRPFASQNIATESGKKYRVRASWSKDLVAEDDMVSSISVKIYNDTNKTSLNTKKEFYEDPKVMQGVFIESVPTYMHYDYVELGQSVNQLFELTNKDDRIAQNCSPPYLTGDVSHFLLVDNNCGTQDLPVGESCSITVSGKPTSIGLKTAYIKRNCTDEYGSPTLLNTKVQVFGYRNYTGTTSYNGGFYQLSGQTWRKYATQCHRYTQSSGEDNGTTYTDRFGTNWYSASELNNWVNQGTGYFLGSCTSTSSCSCSNSSQTPSIPSEFIKPAHEITPPQIEYPFVANNQLDPSNITNQSLIDFVFTAQSNLSTINISPILKFHRGFADNIIVEELSDNSGSPSLDSVSTANGNAIWELQPITNSDYTSPGYDPVFFTLMDGSDWNLRYVNQNTSCPIFFNKIKSSHIATQIGYDDNDNKCDDVSSPEDPTNNVFSWSNIGFDRLPEFGTETIECRMDNCPVTSSVRDIEHSLDTIYPSSGISGTQQGSAHIFVYDVNSFSGLANNGGVGLLGKDDLPKINETRLCYKTQDASTEGLDSEFAANPIVYFRKYNWQAIRVDNSGNYGDLPVNNGKKAKIYKKLNRFVRYLIEKELF